MVMSLLNLGKQKVDFVSCKNRLACGVPSFETDPKIAPNKKNVQQLQ